MEVECASLAGRARIHNQVEVTRRREEDNHTRPADRRPPIRPLPPPDPPTAAFWTGLRDGLPLTDRLADADYPGADHRRLVLARGSGFWIFLGAFGIL